MTTKHKNPEKIYKELLARYQQDGYSIKQAKKYATEDTEEILMDRSGLALIKDKPFNKMDK
jgi:hypothetical protein